MSKGLSGQSEMSSGSDFKAKLAVSLLFVNVIHLFIEQTPLLNTSYISINIHLQGLLYHADPIP